MMPLNCTKKIFQRRPLLDAEYTKNTHRLATSVAMRMLRSFALNLFRAPSRLF